MELPALLDGAELWAKEVDSAREVPVPRLDQDSDLTVVAESIKPDYDSDSDNNKCENKIN